MAAFYSPANLALHPDVATDPKLLQNYAVIHDQDRAGWQQWWGMHRAEGEPPNGLLVEDGNLALQAALEGLGIALLRSSLVDVFAREGRPGLLPLSSRRAAVVRGGGTASSLDRRSLPALPLD